jgi:hypothetical protein
LYITGGAIDLLLLFFFFYSGTSSFFSGSGQWLFEP